MLVQVTNLCYWKTEHGDLTRCQDASTFDPQRGLFAVADGAGTTLFPAIWASILVRHFVNIPLMNDHMFEVEWWVRLAQDEYKREVPNVEQLSDWSVRQKAQNQGSDSTLATLRISAVTPSSAEAELLVFGDSCVIIGDTQSKRINSFVLQHEAEFNQAPICIPSALKFFNRSFHRCSTKSETLRPHHIVILATDAVSRWILSHDAVGQWDAFEEVCNQSEESWPAFINGCRERKAMVDDDATALVLKFQADGAGEGCSLGWTTAHDHPIKRDGKYINVIQERKEAFEKARQDGNNELVAIYYGDGNDLKSAGVDEKKISTNEIEHAQAIADALKEVMRAFRQAQNSPGLAAKVEPVWRQYGHLLENERCATTLLETLRRNGVNLALPGQLQPSLPPNYPPRPAAETAEQLELRFFKALSADDDDTILETTQAIEAARSRYPNLHTFTQEEVRRIDLSKSRRQALKNLQHALSGGSLEQVEAAYDRTLIDHKRLILLTADQQKRVHLACQLTEAFKERNDEAVELLFQQISPTDYQTFFIPQDLQTIQAAIERKNALMIFRTALKSGRLEQIANTSHLILSYHEHLTESERELLALAQEFVVAYQTNDDDPIVTAYNKIMKSHYRECVAFTKKEEDRILHAQNNVDVRRTVVAKVKNQEITVDMVRKVCKIKELYILYHINILKQEMDHATNHNTRDKIELQILALQSEIDPQQSAMFALEDIIDDIIIEEMISEKRQQSMLPDNFDVQSYISSLSDAIKPYVIPDYDALLKVNKLTDKDIEEVLLLLVRRKRFFEHFQNQSKSGLPSIWQSNMPSKQLEKRRKDAGITYTLHGSDQRQRGLWLSKLLQQGL